MRIEINLADDDKIYRDRCASTLKGDADLAQAVAAALNSINDACINSTQAASSVLAANAESYHTAYQTVEAKIGKADKNAERKKAMKEAAVDAVIGTALTALLGPEAVTRKRVRRNREVCQGRNELGCEVRREGAQQRRRERCGDGHRQEHGDRSRGRAARRKRK
jgi:hypothetical protein